MSYRVELASTGRAVCKATHCKKEGTKIEKGALRQGTLVTINEHSSMAWRHWGCVTPKILANWKESSEMDMELVDGYEDLPDEDQQKVKRALEQVHVDDDDWNGDVEMNRYNPSKPMQGMFVKTPKKKAGEDSDKDEEASPTKKKAAKKRGRANQDDDDENVEPAPKKTKAKGKKAAQPDDESEPEPAAKPKKAARGKKPKAEDADPELDPIPVPKKGRGKKAKSAEVVVSDDDDEPAVDEPQLKKAPRGKKGTAKPAKIDDDDDAPVSKPQKRAARGKKAAVKYED